MIKFRVWDKEDKAYTANKYLFEIVPDGKAFDLVSAVDFDDSNGLVIEQYTGLKDVSGKEIYEGDIIQYSHQFYEDLFTGAIGRETGYIGTVVKNNGAFGILINRMSYTDAHSNYYHAKDFVPFCEFDDPEADMGLKGNVHENPDLLEEKK